jgi:hypothetical protein
MVFGDWITLFLGFRPDFQVLCARNCSHLCGLRCWLSPALLNSHQGLQAQDLLFRLLDFLEVSVSQTSGSAQHRGCWKWPIDTAVQA